MVALHGWSEKIFEDIGFRKVAAVAKEAIDYKEVLP